MAKKKQAMPLLWVGDSHTLDRLDAEEIADVVRGHKPQQTTKVKRKKKRKPNAA